MPTRLGKTAELVMPQVDIKWRPSGGRGEYEHVPGDVLMDRRIVIEPVSAGGNLIQTDAWGRQKDGKPRLRRENPNDRSLLNVPPLIAALALFPDPMREDKGVVTLPLRDKGYVLSSVTCHVEYAKNGDAICTPLRMQVLHDASVVDLAARLRSVGELVARGDLPAQAALAANHYRALLQAGRASSEFREVADELRAFLELAPEAAGGLDQPSLEIAPQADVAVEDNILFENLSVDETKRKLVSHYKIERDRNIRRIKVEQFKAINGALFCEACDFSFEEKYGEYAKDVIDVHHVRPLATLLPNTMTTLADLMLLCSNCHRVVHRKKEPLSREQLAELLKKSAEPTS